MKPITRAALLAPAGIALLVGIALAVRPRGRATEPPRVLVPKESGCRPAEAHVPARPASTPVSEEALRAEVRKAAADRPDELNALQERLSQGLAEGAVTAEQIMEMFRSESDPAVLDLLGAALSANPEAADRPGVLDVFLELARSDGLPARRQAALAFLGGAWDKDGRVRDALFVTARTERDTNLRLTALGTLRAYSIKNHERGASVTSDLLEFARTEATAEVRAQALASVEMGSAGGETAGQLAGFLNDPCPEVRLAAADKLGDAPSASRRDVLPLLERALRREADAGIRNVLLYSLVKAGRAEAAESLRRLARQDPDLRAHAEDYLAILARENVDGEDLAQEKAALEAARSK